MTRSDKGFTLIELMVVVSIVSLLSSIVAASVNTARAKGRDAARIGSVHSMRNALELYNNDHGHYPLHAQPVSMSAVATDDLSPYLKGNMSNLSAGTIANSSLDSMYATNSSGSNYELLIRVESSGNSRNNSCSSGTFSAYNDGTLYCYGVNADSGTSATPQQVSYIAGNAEFNLTESGSNYVVSWLVTSVDLVAGCTLNSSSGWWDAMIVDYFGSSTIPKAIADGGDEFVLQCQDINLVEHVIGTISRP